MRKKTSNDATSKERTMAAANSMKTFVVPMRPDLRTLQTEGPEIKELVLKDDTQLKATSRGSKLKKETKGGKKKALNKTNSQESKEEKSLEGKMTASGVVELRDLSAEEEKHRKDFEQNKIRVIKSTINRFERQKSPVVARQPEKIHIILNKNIGSLGMKTTMGTIKDGLLQKVLKKDQNREFERVETEGDARRKTSPKPLEELNSRKRNSAERLGKVESAYPLKERRFEENEQERSIRTPKAEGKKASEEKNWKAIDNFDKVKEKRAKPTSPASGETRKVLGFFDKMVSLKKK